MISLSLHRERYQVEQPRSIRLVVTRLGSLPSRRMAPGCVTKNLGVDR
ncbi:MAG: hypothetical protein HYV09_09045 [Deltaproteobacteria bacterium]|nr:hypothetical protein [Deltaproteobacteria bacterium]